VHSTDSEEEEERENGHKAELGRLARRRLQAMVRGLSGRRGELARCMAFSLEHAEAAAEVTDLIVSSLLVEGTPVPRKVSRLYLICDILHNSAIPLPGAWRFRQEFQNRLGLVFDHLSGIYHSFPGRITAETFKTQITSVIDIWEDWIVFPPEFTLELRTRLEGQPNTIEPEQVEVPSADVELDTMTEGSRFKASSFKPAAQSSIAAPGTENTDGASINELDPDLDGVPLDELDGASLDGAALDDLDGEPLQDDVDGAPLDGEDLDGDPMDEDVDGAPVET
jgi:U2-associated protein SR140